MKKLPNIHPGFFLKTELLQPMGISQYRAAKEIKVSETAISEIVREKRDVSAEMGLRLDKFFGFSEGFFFRMQNLYDLFEAKEKVRVNLAHIRTYQHREPVPAL